MIIAIPKETAPTEQRVALVPHDLDALRDHVVKLERGAGEAAGFDDILYERMGAHIVDSDDIYSDTDLVAWVKPPAHPDSMTLSLKRDAIVLGFQNPLKPIDQQRIVALKQRGIHSLAFENTQRSEATIEFDALAQMSHMAGEIAYSEARTKLKPGTRLQPLVIGGGAAGMAAVQAAVHDPECEPPILITRGGVYSEQYRRTGEVHITLPHSDDEHIATQVRKWRPNLVIGAAATRGKKPPMIIGAQTLGALTSNSVIVDLAGTAGGNCTATRLNSEVVLDNGILVVHRSNYPSSRPQEASMRYSKCVSAMIRHIHRDGRQVEHYSEYL